MNDKAIRKEYLLATLVIVVSLFIRAYNINGALFDYNPLRQALNASVARNFAQDALPNFFLPHVDNMGSAPGYLMFELPVLPGIAALLIKLFGQHNWVFRFPPILFFALSAFYFYKICLRLSGFRVSLFALVFYCFSPVSILINRVFQVESLMMAALMASVYYLIDYIENKKILSYVFLTIGLTLFVLCKFPNLYILPLVFFIPFVFKKPESALDLVLPVAVVVLINVWWWVLFSGPIRDMFPNEYTITDGRKVFGFGHVWNVFKQYSLSPAYWWLTFKQCFIRVFSPLIFISAVAGFFAEKERKQAAFFISWFVVGMVFILAIPTASLQDYYKVHLLPAVAFMAAVGYLWVLGALKRARLKAAFNLIFWCLAAVSVFVVVYPVIRPKPVFEKQIVIGKIVEGLSKKDDLVIASFGPDSMLLFYCNRKGWSQYLLSDEDNIRILEERRKEGASFFVSGNLDELDHDVRFKEYMLRSYALIARGEREHAAPRLFSPEYLVWKVLGNNNGLGRKSLGYAIFDLRGKREHKQ